MGSESERLHDLASYRIMDSGAEAPFDRIVELAASIFSAPIAYIALLDEERQWFKARLGLQERETPRSWAFCDRTIRRPPALVVPDARAEPDFAGSPLVQGPQGIRFYAGAVINSAAGRALGTVCVLDRRPRPDGLSPSAMETLQALARLAEAELERRKVTLEAQEAAKRFRDFVETSADWYWEMDSDLRFSSFEGNYPDMDLNERFLGRQRWEAHNSQRAGVWDRHRADLEARRPFRNLEMEGRTTKGERIFINSSGKPIFDEEGRFIGYRGTSRDITQRQLIVEAVERSEENFRAIFEHHPDPMWVVEPETLRFLLANEAAIELYGYSQEEFLTMRTQDIPVAEEQERLKPFLASIPPDGVTNSEWRHRTKAGRTITVFMRGQPIRYNGKQARLIVARDITAWKEAEAELERQEAKLRQSQRLEAIGQLTGGVAHDFNNLLTVILGNAERLQEALSGDPAMREAVETTRNAAERAAALTSRLLAFSRRQSLRPQATDIRAVIDGMEVLLRRTLSETISLKVVSAPDAWPALVDPAQLENTILNLCINARDAMPRGGNLTLSLANSRDAGAEAAEALPPGDFVALSIADDGTGMPPEALARAFEPFFTTKDVGKGSGLGLSMVYGFVAQSGGQVAIDSELGKGTVVRLYLPRATSPIPLSKAAPARTEPPAGNERVLLAEDDELVRVHVANQLRSLGYGVIAVPDGPSALRVLEAGEAVDLLFTDMVMPGGLDGRQLAEAARRLRPGLPVLVSTGYTQTAIQAGEWEAAGLHLLSKPYLRRELAAKLRKVLEKPAEPLRSP